MTNTTRTIEVALGERSYPIIMGYDHLAQCVAGLKDYTTEDRVMLICDSRVHELYGGKLAELLERAGYVSLSYIISPGEESKSWEQGGLILEKMLGENLGRKTPVLALGGGVVGDLSGFVAALYRRGVPFIQIPTTLLAQVDSSVGGKVAVNHAMGKNMLGTFYQPVAVWADMSTLDTLPEEEWLAGLAEVIKYALIRDEAFLTFLEEHTQEILRRDRLVIPDIIQRCCQIKAEIVTLDERDEDLRNTLNFGHTIGHALESATYYKQYRHGEAVAIGMMGALELAYYLGSIDRDSVERVRRLLLAWGLPLSYPGHLLEDVLELLIHDKKVSGQELTFVLPVALGQVVLKKAVPREIVRKAMQEITK